MLGVGNSFIEGLKDNEMRDILKDLENRFREKSLTVFGKEIPYCIGGQGDKVVVILPGTTGRAMNYFKYLHRLSEEAVVIGINYPIVETIGKIGEMVRAVIENETAQKVILVGHSLGGIIAQEIVKEAPGLVDSMVLINTYGRDGEVPSNVLKGHKESNEKLVKTFRSFTFGFMRKGFAKRITGGIDMVEVSHKPFWKAYYEEIFNQTSSDDMKSNYGLMVDFWSREATAVTSAATDTSMAWDGRAVIVEAEIDLEKKVPEKEALIRLYPNGERIGLEGSANMFIVKHEEKLMEIIKTELSINA